MNDLKELAKQARILTLQSIHQAGSGHPGGSLSSVEILVQLFFETMQPQPYSFTDPNRDIFILSKGHGCPALYSIFSLLGVLTREQALELRQLGSPVQGHPSYPHLPQVEVSSGSLGVACSVGVGVALGRKLTGHPGRVYCLLGDGDINEGITTEAARIANHYKLDNLCWVLDWNSKMSDEHSVLMVDPFEEFEALGWKTRYVNGHDFDKLALAFQSAQNRKTRPTLLVADTIKGKGTFYEDDPAGGHGSLTISEEDLERCLDEISN